MTIYFSKHVQPSSGTINSKLLKKKKKLLIKFSSLSYTPSMSFKIIQIILLFHIYY